MIHIHEQFEKFTDGNGIIFWGSTEHDPNANNTVLDIMYDTDISEWSIYDRYRDTTTTNVSDTIIIELVGKSQYENMLEVIRNYGHNKVTFHSTQITYGQSTTKGYIKISFDDYQWIEATLNISEDLRNHNNITITNHSIKSFNESYLKDLIYMIAASNLFNHYNTP